MDIPLSFTGKRWNYLGDILHERVLKPQALFPPSIFPDMQRAVDRIHTAIERGERIGIFGDYDCDGVTAVAQLVRYFRRHNIEPWVRLPHRERDGYGLKKHVIQEIVDAEIHVLITADTGITAVEEVRMLQEHGIDTIVTDHHQPQDTLPLAYALIHPALCKYPTPHPCGAGVSYKLIQALEGGLYTGHETDIALAMIGTIADVVELQGENRTLTQLGLQAFNALTQGPLFALKEQCCAPDSVVTSTDIAFRIAPRINAAGRMADASIALEAVLEGGDALTQLSELNTKRQACTSTLLDEALSTIDTKNPPLLLSAISEEYPHGIVGLISGRLTEQFGRPSLVAHTDGHMCTASLRSTAAYNIAMGLTRCSDLLETHGGHAQAAGCTFLLENSTALLARLQKDIAESVDVSALTPQLNIDMTIDHKDISAKFCNDIAALQPFGHGNPEPLFLLSNVSLTAMRTCGKEDAHLTGRIHGIKSIGFNLGFLAEKSEPVDIVTRIELSKWNGKVEPQLVIVDAAVSSWQFGS